MLDLRVLRDVWTEPGARDVFEALTFHCVRADHPTAQRIRPDPGDSGIDTVVGELGASSRIWQAKYFVDGVGPSQQDQIRAAWDAIQKAQASGIVAKVASWTLCLPRDLSVSELRWFEGWKAKQQSSTGCKIELWAGSAFQSFAARPALKDIFARAREGGIGGTTAADALAAMQQAAMQQLAEHLEEGVRRSYRSSRLLLVGFAVVIVGTTVAAYLYRRDRSLAHVEQSHSQSQEPRLVPRTRSDLLKQLDDQISLLQSACEQYDNGSELHAKEIAARLRVLLHDTDASPSLLKQLNHREGTAFLSTSKPMDPGNFMGHFGLVVIELPSTYRPALDRALEHETLQRFEDWWRVTEVLRAGARTHQLSEYDRPGLTREDLVVTVAEMDGGSAVRSALRKDYEEMSRRNGLGFVIRKNKPGSTPIALGDPVPASLRQIGYEFLRTFELNQTAWQR